MIRYSPNLPSGLRFVGKERVRKTACSSSRTNVEFMEALCKHLIRNPDPLVVPIYRFECDFKKRHSGAYHYSYDMMMLGMLSNPEKKLIDIIVERFEEFGESPSWSTDEFIIKGREEYSALCSFMDTVINQNRHFDLHDGNIMVDLEENYRLVDLEGFINYELNHPSNDWITRDDKA